MENNVGDNLYFILVTGSLGMAVLAGIVVCVVIYYQKRRIKHQHELQQIQLRHQLDLLQNSIEIQEKERKRFAEDLHDEAGAILSAVKLNLHRVAQGDLATINETRKLLDTAMTGIRRVSHDLSPPGLESFGLCPTLTDLCKKLESDQMQIYCDFTGFAQSRFPQQVETAVYRIVNELLNNTFKHSGASEVKVQLAGKNGGLVLEYADNGKGLESGVMGKMTGTGLKNIESRVFALGGKMTIEHMPGKGFGAKIHIPVHKT